MPGYPKGQVESGAANPHGAALDPGAAVGAEPGRPARQRRRRAVEGERERGDPERQGVDAAVRHGQLNTTGDSPAVPTGAAPRTN